jgi:hypothetical protein
MVANVQREVPMSDSHLYLDEPAHGSQQDAWQVNTPWPVGVAASFILTVSLGLWAIIWMLATRGFAFISVALHLP